MPQIDRPVALWCGGGGSPNVLTPSSRMCLFARKQPLKDCDITKRQIGHKTLAMKIQCGVKTNDETRMTWDLKFNVNASKLQLLSSIGGVGASWNLLLLVALKPKQSVTTYKSPGGRVELPSGIFFKYVLVLLLYFCFRIRRSNDKNFM